MTCPNGNPHCRNGVVSTYWGHLHHPMYGRIDVNGEHDYPDCPGATFYGGSGHQACGCRVRTPENVESPSGGKPVDTERANRNVISNSQDALAFFRRTTDSPGTK